MVSFKSSLSLAIMMVVCSCLSSVGAVENGTLAERDVNDKKCEIQQAGKLNAKDKKCVLQLLDAHRHDGYWLGISQKCQNSGHIVHLKSQQKGAWLNPANCHEGGYDCLKGAANAGVVSNWYWKREGVAECQFQYWVDI